jgi:hypothetical protein
VKGLNGGAAYLHLQLAEEGIHPGGSEVVEMYGVFSQFHHHRSCMHLLGAGLDEIQQLHIHHWVVLQNCP